MSIDAAAAAPPESSSSAALDSSDLRVLPLDSSELRTSFGWARVYNSFRELEPAWREQALAGVGNDFRFYEVIEQSMPGQFLYRYFALENAATGEVAVQPFFFVDQDLLLGLPKNVRSAVAKLRQRWPRLFTMRILVVGCAAAEAHLGHSAPWVVQALQEALAAYLPESRASLVLFKDFPASYRESLAPLTQAGYRRVPSMPAAELALDFPSFEEFVQQRLSKVFRKNLRRKLRALDGAPPVTMEMRTEVEAIAPELHALYLQTRERSTQHFEKLTPEFLVELGRRMPDRVRFFIWRQEGRIVAFNLCMEHEGTLYDLDMGLDYRVALDLHLYFVTWRDMIEWSLKNGLKRYRTGPLNYDPKLHLKMRLAPLDLYARHVSPWINPVFKFAINYLQPARHDPVLKRFANFGEL